MSAITTNNLTKTYKQGNGILNVNINIEEGECIGLVGVAGSGKTTLLRTLMNVLNKTSGTATIMENDTVAKSAYIKEIVGYMPSDLAYYKHHKAKSILAMMLAMQPNSDKKNTYEMCSYLGLDVNKKLSQMSVCERKKLDLIGAFCGLPKIVLLDEPTLGMDSKTIAKYNKMISGAVESGVTVVIATRILETVANICTRTIIINGGTIIEQSEVDDFKNLKGHRIKVKTNENIDNALMILRAKNVSNSNGYLSFYTAMNVDSVIKALSHFTIDDFEIQSPLTEDAVDYLENKQLELEEENF